MKYDKIVTCVFMLLLISTQMSAQLFGGQIKTNCQGFDLNTICATATISTTPCSTVNGATINDDISTTKGIEYNWTGATTSGMANTSTTRALVEINGQCWMRTNMANDATAGSGFQGYYNNTSAGTGDDGKLYAWSRAMNGSSTERDRGICPTGWHVPSDCEWIYLEASLGMNAAQQDDTGLRNSCKVGDKLSNEMVYGNNSSGFSALFAGQRISDITGTFRFVDQNFAGYFWTSSTLNTSGRYRRLMGSLLGGAAGGVERRAGSKTIAYSVRCIKD